MAAAPSVSVVIPTYNRASYLPASVESVLSQTVRPAQVIVVDDGSTDSTPEAVRPFLDSIEYVRKDNGGKSAALNLVLPRVRGDCLWIFDDDDFAFPRALESQLEALARAPQAGFAYGAYQRGSMDASGRWSITATIAALDVAPERLFLTLLDRCLLAQQGMLVRTGCYRDVGPFDERLVRSQDYDMMLRLAHRFRGARNPELTFILREHSGARGSASQRVDFSSRHRAWADFDRIIARRYHETLRLDEYLGRGDVGDAALGAADVRRALLARASIMGRKGLWDAAAKDLLEIARSSSSPELSDEERRDVERIAECTYWECYPDLIRDRSLVSSLRRELGRTALGRRVRVHLARGILQRALYILDKDTALGAKLLNVYARLLGPEGAADTLLARVPFMKAMLD